MTTTATPPQPRTPLLKLGPGGDFTREYHAGRPTWWRLGLMLRGLRWDRGMSEHEVAAATGLTLQSVAAVEGGRLCGEPSDAVLVALDQRKPVTPAELLTYAELAGLLGGREALRTLTVLRAVDATAPVGEVARG